MKHICRIVSLIIVGGLTLESLAVGTGRAEEPDPAGIEFFEKKIRPVFAEHCWSCHSEESKTANKLKGGLRLDSPSAIRAGGDSGAMFVAGKPGESLLIKALRHEELQMPPDAKLADDVIERFSSWISMGAPMPADSREATSAKRLDWTEARQLWAFRVPVEHPLPAVKQAEWPTSMIDHFILAEMEKHGLTPVRRASKRELIRRATFDLIGLPPTPEEIDNFLKDESRDAFATVVDRLLLSPHYGERWARYWLDLSRYADDQGNSFLSPTPQAYLYRDWVVDALNRDLPYDEFIRLQVAGDELPVEGATAPVNYEQRLAGLGFQGLGPQFRKGAAGEAKAKADELEDRVDTLSRGILGLTVSCARCHDHKFDPIPTRDYYSLAAAYNGANWSDRMLASPEAITRLREWEQQVAQQRKDLENWQAETGRKIGRRSLEKLDAYLVAAWRVRAAEKQQSPQPQAQPVDVATVASSAGVEPYFLNRLMKSLAAAKEGDVLESWRRTADETPVSGAVPEAIAQKSALLKNDVAAALGKLEAKAALTAPEEGLLKSLWQDGVAPFFVGGKDAEGLFTPEEKVEFQAKQNKLTQLVSAEPPRGPMMPSVSGGGEPLKVFVRGNPLQLGEAAPPGFLRILSGKETNEEGARFTRLDLANAIVDPQNPLTARVLVNRVWHYHFGRGIVATLGNFGKQGRPPTHPDLLDTLAVRFMKSGWSMKTLHREIMLSSTYQLSSERNESNIAIDPDNYYLWRGTPRRLDFEAWRDTMLSVAGKLDPTVGGPTLDLKTPAVKEVPGADFFTRLVGLELDDPKNGRRTLYCIVSRYSPSPTAGLFDFPEPNVASDLRNVTTIPQQQLFVLNSAFTIEMARAFASRLGQAASDDAGRIKLAWVLAYGRPPTDAELELGLEFLRQAQGDVVTDEKRVQPPGTEPVPVTGGTADRLATWEQLCHAILSANEFVFVP